MDAEMQIMNGVFDQLRRKLAATTRPPSGETVFVLLTNNCTVREPCGVCGQSHKDAYWLAWVFSRAGALCDSCAETLAPALYRAACDLSALFGLGDRDGQDEEIVNQVSAMLPRFGSTNWDNPPDHAGLLTLLDALPVRSRIDELIRRDAVDDDLPF